MQHRILVILAFALCFVSAARAPLFAEVKLPSREEDFFRQLEELRALREKDPQAFFEKVREKKENLRKDLETLRQEDPEHFHQFLQRQGQLKRKKFEYFRQHHPEAFQYFVARRMERVHQIAQKDPERFGHFLNRHPGFQERYTGYLQRRARFPQRGGLRPGGEGQPLLKPARKPGMRRLESLESQDPERFRQVMKNHPRFQKRYDQFQRRRRDQKPSVTER